MLRWGCYRNVIPHAHCPTTMLILYLCHKTYERECCTTHSRGYTFDVFLDSALQALLSCDSSQEIYLTKNEILLLKKWFRYLILQLRLEKFFLVDFFKYDFIPTKMCLHMYILNLRNKGTAITEIVVQCRNHYQLKHLL